MRIYVCLKSPVNITKNVEQIPFDVEGHARTLRTFIAECVRTCIRGYTERGENGESPMPLTADQYERMRHVGKFAFGVHYNKNEISEERAIETAVQAVSDGIVCIFKGEEALFEMDDEIEIREGDVFTFVKLTLLSGRMW